MDNTRAFTLFAKVACIQMDIAWRNKEANLKSAIALMTDAADNGANLMVLPELFNSGYTFSSREEIASFAEPIPSGISVETLSDFARKRNAYIVASMAEASGIDLYNTAVLVGPDVYICKYRKTHLCGDEVYWFET